MKCRYVLLGLEVQTLNGGNQDDGDQTTFGVDRYFTIQRDPH